MKNKNYRLVIKNIGGVDSFFIEQNVKYIFGLLGFWDILETGTNFKSELEAERFLKQLEVKKGKWTNKNYPSKVYYYDSENDRLVDAKGNPKGSN